MYIKCMRADVYLSKKKILDIPAADVPRQEKIYRRTI